MYMVHGALNELVSGHPLMGLWKEVCMFGIKVSDIAPQGLCKVFEDNCSASEMAHLLKICPHTKHINQYFHHFRDSVQCCEITLPGTSTTSQRVEMLTKPLPAEPFQTCRKSILGW